MTKRREPEPATTETDAAPPATQETAPDAPPPQIPRRILERDTRPLKVPLSDVEVRAASRRMGALLRQRGALETSFEEVRKKQKAALAELDTEAARLAIVLDTETEQRDIECVTEVNFADGTAETKRLDTNEVIQSRPLTPAERQQEMFHQEQGKQGRKKK